jgi:hypothetical protein
MRDVGQCFEISEHFVHEAFSNMAKQPACTRQFFSCGGGCSSLRATRVKKGMNDTKKTNSAVPTPWALRKTLQSMSFTALLP